MLNKDEVPFRDNVKDQIELIGNRIKITKLEDKVKRQKEVILNQAKTISRLMVEVYSLGGYDDD